MQPSKFASISDATSLAAHVLRKPHSYKFDIAIVEHRKYGKILLLGIHRVCCQINVSLQNVSISVTLSITGRKQCLKDRMAMGIL